MSFILISIIICISIIWIFAALDCIWIYLFIFYVFNRHKNKQQRISYKNLSIFIFKNSFEDLYTFYSIQLYEVYKKFLMIL